jgi:hypothetical protein
MVVTTYKIGLRSALIVLALALSSILPAAQDRGKSAASDKAVRSSTGWTATKTPDGDPDLQGVWTYATATPLERPASSKCNAAIDDPRLGQPCGLADKEELSETEVVEFEQQATQAANADRRGGSQDAELARAYNNFWYDERRTKLSTRRTSIVIDPPDGRVPPMTPEGLKRQAAAPRYNRADGPEDRPNTERCLSFNAGPPMLPTFYNSNVQIVQGPGYVVVLNEMIHDARVVALGRRFHVRSDIRLWMGDSIGHWDGNSLVVDTSNLTGKSRFRGASVSMHLTERFTRVDADTMLYRFTVEDPTTWVRPWTGEFPLRRTTEQLYEYACHEGNYGIAGVLRGARLEEKESAGSQRKR